MTQQHIDFLIAREATDGEMVKADYMRFLDDDWKTYEKIYQENINPSFSFEHGCGNCRFDMVKRVFNYFWNVVKPSLPTELQSDEMSDEQINQAHEQEPKPKPILATIETILKDEENPKKRGRKAKK